MSRKVPVFALMILAACVPGSTLVPAEGQSGDESKKPPAAPALIEAAPDLQKKMGLVMFLQDHIERFQAAVQQMDSGLLS
jgi:hypothetical protein